MNKELLQQYAAIKAAISTLKDVEKAMKMDVDQDLYQMYEDVGKISVDIAFGDYKAKIYATESKGQIVHYDTDEFMEFMQQHGLVEYRPTLAEDWQDFCEATPQGVIYKSTGEVVPDTYYEPPRFKNATARIPHAKEFLQAALQSGVEVFGLPEGE